MCGRYTITVNSDELSDRFGCIIVQKLGGPRYNMAPQQIAPVITRINGRNELQLMKWGLVPFWAKESSIGSRLINARWETLHEKPAFKHLLRRKRCLVPADGYYEWQRENGQKRPYRIVLPSRKLFGFAGLWDEWSGGDEEPLRSFTIITADAAPNIRSIHQRMPFIITPEQEKEWLNPDLSGKDINDFLSGFKPLDSLELYPVSKLVNSVSNDTPECIEALEENQNK